MLQVTKLIDNSSIAEEVAEGVAGLSVSN